MAWWFLLGGVITLFSDVMHFLGIWTFRILSNLPPEREGLRLMLEIENATPYIRLMVSILIFTGRWAEVVHGWKSISPTKRCLLTRLLYLPVAVVLFRVPDSELAFTFAAGIAWLIVWVSPVATWDLCGIAWAFACKAVIELHPYIASWGPLGLVYTWASVVILFFCWGLFSDLLKIQKIPRPVTTGGSTV